MKFSQRRVVLLLALGLAIMSVTLALVLTSPHPSARETAITVTQPQCKYIVGGYAGYVAVYLAGQTEPLYITDTRIAALPAADRALLEAGIEVQTEEALSLLLEDYGS